MTTPAKGSLKTEGVVSVIIGGGVPAAVASVVIITVINAATIAVQAGTVLTRVSEVRRAVTMGVLDVLVADRGV